MDATKIRDLALKILDDDEGISNEAWPLLSELLTENGHDDIIEHVEACKNRVFLMSDSPLSVRENEYEEVLEDLYKRMINLYPIG